MKALSHIAVIAIGLFLCLGLPWLLCGGAATADAVSGATVEVPDRPSGQFVVILNRDRHPLTASEWSDFFLEKPVGVIMEDVQCVTPAGDAPGLELAKRYQARLAANQMALKTQEGLLTVSKAELGRYDVLVLSKEAAAAWDYSAVCARPEAVVLNIG